MPSIITSFKEWVERDPEHLLYAFHDVEGRITERYTYAQFLQRTTDIAAHIRRTQPLSPGARVLLAYPPGVEMICAFFACVRLGLIPVPIYPPTSHGFRAALDKADFIARDCDAAAVLTNRAFYWSMRLNETRHTIATLTLRRTGIRKLTWIVSSDADTGTSSDLAEAHSDVLFLQYTSGSTSEPKGVIVTHDNILHNCEAVVDHRPIGVSWLPQYHDMGLIGYYLYFALKGGTTHGFSPFDFIQRPTLWLETISKYRGTASSAPNFAFEYCLRPEKVPASTLEGLDLSSLRFLMNAAEPVRAKVCREFLRRFEPHGLRAESFFCAYGLAEFTLAVSNYGRTIQAFDRALLRRHIVRTADPDAPEAETTTLVSCGEPLGTSELKIVNVSAGPREAHEAEVGEIWIRGPSKCVGYWSRPELSATIFEARLPGEDAAAEGWLRSGDMGFVHEGELYVCGRLKDMLIVRGQNFYPQDIEAVIESDAAIRKGCTAAFACERDGQESLVIVAELKHAKREANTHELNRRLLERVGVAGATYVFIKARTIAKTSSGKIARHIVRNRWLEGRLQVIREVDLNVTALASAPVGSRAWLGRFGLTGEETWSLEDAGFDSLKLVDFAQALKDQLEASGGAGVSGAVDLRVLQKIAICELFELVDQVVAASPHAALRLRRAFADLGREHRGLEAEMMRHDAKCRIDIAGLRRAPAEPSSTDGAVLLTGGTGFFGPFLLRSLLEQGTDDVHVLVRGTTEDAMRRLHDGLLSVAPDGVSCPARWEERVHPVCGDLAAVKLGLGDKTWQMLAERVHTVYHSAAQVNYLHDYQALREPNVSGTNEVIRLALSHRTKVLNHISTTFVFGWSVKETLLESDMNDEMDRLDFGYSQSKWVSEQVVRDAMRQGLPARIFRPALLTPSLSGGGANLDITLRLLAFMMNHGISTTAQNQVSLCPADLAADNIVAIANVPDGLGATYHVTRDEYARLSDVTTILSELTGRRFRHHALPEFVPEVIQRCHPGDVLFPLLDFLVRSVDNISAMEFKRYDNSNYQRMRAASPRGRGDPPLHDVVLGILRFLRKHALVA